MSKMTTKEKKTSLQVRCAKTAKLLGFGKNWTTGLYIDCISGKMCLMGAFSRAGGHSATMGTGNRILSDAIGVDSAVSFNDGVAKGAEDIIGVLDQLTVETPAWFK